MKTFERALVDTNVLVYTATPTNPYHKQCKDLCNRLLRGEANLCLTPQILLEFYATITNPRCMKNPCPSKEALQEVVKYIGDGSQLIFPPPDTIFQIIKLLERISVKKQEVFDLQLVVIMLFNKVYQIYTFDEKVFKLIPEITVLTP